MNATTKHFRFSTCVALVLGTMTLFAQTAHAQIAACPAPVFAEAPPPPLPVYDQPPVPGPGYIWTPGVWAWNADIGDYYWVPGTWIEAPRPGLLWTPGYWGWTGGIYLFHPGYWGEHVGFYGGIAYGYGYTGDGYEGGRWQNGTFFYNRSVTNVTNNITNVYEKPVDPRTANNVSFNGGKGGVEARPTAEQKTFDREARFAPTPIQAQHAETASKTQELFSKSNHGKPAMTATPRPAAFSAETAAPNKDELRPAALPKQPVPVPETGKPAPETGRLAPAVKPAPETGKPLIEERRPAAVQKPQGPERKPQDAAIEKKPAVSEKTPERTAKPEVAPHPAKPEAKRPPPPTARAEPHKGPDHPPAKKDNKDNKDK